MKTELKYLIAILFLATALFTSCDSFLDKGPEENLSVEEVFQQRNYVQGWLYNLYSGVPMEMDFHSVISYDNPFTGGSDEIEITPGYAACQYFLHKHL